MKNEFLCSTKDDVPVFYEARASHATTHFEDTPGLKELVKEVIENTQTTGEAMWFETDMGRVVGTSDLVETDGSDDILYASRPNREGYSRFTKSRKPAACSVVTIAMRPRDLDAYELTSAWIGPKGHPFPDDPAATGESQSYWSGHALIWGTQEVIPATIRTDSPW